MNSTIKQILLLGLAGSLIACGGDSDTVQASEAISTPTSTPTVMPSSIPSATPTTEPSSTPAATPSAEPSLTPSSTPTVMPSSTPAAIANVVDVVDVSTGSRSEPVFAYYDLDNNQLVALTEEEAASNSDWDIAFNRTNVYVNSNAGIYFTNNTDTFYDDSGNPIAESFTNATEENQLDAFVAQEVNDLTEEDFKTDITVNVIDGFYNYNVVDHSVTANDQAYYVVESDLSYSRFRVTNLVQNLHGLDSLTLSVADQDLLSGEESFGVEYEISISAAECGDAVYVDFSTQAIVTSDADWDLSIPCSNNLLSFSINIADDARAINDQESSAMSGVDAESLSYYPWLANETTILAFKEYGDARSGYGWGQYGVAGGHGLWPNYAIYVVRTETTDYKFQIVGYYHSETQASGSYSFRYIEL